MEKKTVFVKTSLGQSEMNGHSSELYGDVKRILLLVDDKSNLGDITKRAPPSLRDSLPEVLKILLEDGYISDGNTAAAAPQKSNLKISSPAFKMSTPKDIETAGPVTTKSQSGKPNNFPAKSELDFSFISTSQEKPEADNVKERALAEAKVFAEAKAKAQAQAEAESKAKLKSQTEAKAQAENAAKAKLEADKLKALQSAQIEAANKAAKLKAYEEAKERARHEVAAKAKLDAASRQKNDAETARQRAEQDALKARAELEATKARVEAEVRSRIEAEVRIKREVEEAAIKAKKEAEKLRLELEAAKAKAEAELKNRLEAEARVKAEIEARIKREAEAERLKIEKERAEREAARVKAEAEIKIRAEAELRVRAEVEARLKAEEEERLKLEVEAERMKLERERAEIDLARIKAEAELKMRTEAELRIRAEVEARVKSEEFARNGDRRRAATRSSDSGVPSLEEEHEQAEKLKQSFVESFNQSKSKQQKSNLFNFKLDTFSLSGKWKKADPSIDPQAQEEGVSSKSNAAVIAEKNSQSDAEAARIKAEQEKAERAKVELEAAERAKAEKEAARRLAEQEEYRLQAEQNERQAKADAETRELAGQQAKQWEEAQRRAAAGAQAERERLERESASVQSKSRNKSGRTSRKPVPVGKIFLGLFIAILIVVTVLPYVWQFDEYIAPVEKEISAQLSQPVRIKKINFALLPMPKLELLSVTVGNGQELQVGGATLYFNFSALLSSTRPINKIVLNKVSLNGTSFGPAVGWIQAAGASEKYPVAHMDLNEIKVTSEEINLPLFSAKADFDSQGKFIKAELKSEDDKLGLELSQVQKRLQIDLKVHESSLPVFSHIKFNDLSVTGVIENGDFTVNDIFAHIYGGTLTGKGQLTWTNGWKLQGQIQSKSLELQSLFPNFGITGELFGESSFSMSGLKLAQLDKDVRLDGSFEAKNGVISKLDIDSIARFGSRQGVTGSRSNFSQLAGTFKTDNRGQRIYLNKMLIGVVSGSGLFEVDASQQLTGKLSVKIEGASGKTVPLHLSGSLKEPLLQAGR